MPAILAALVLPLRQLGDPAFYGPLLKGAGAALVLFAGLLVGTVWGVGALTDHWSGWIGGTLQALGGLASVLLAGWLFIPMTLAISGLFLNEVAEAVERRYYPALPPARGASNAAQIRYAVGFALRVLLLNVVLLPLAFFLPGVGTVLAYALAGYALGAGLFDGVAQRRMSVPESRRLRWRRAFPVFVVGGLAALAATVPGLNLLVPVLGTAAMTHVLHRSGGTPASASRAG
ncbi:EI24 domain-containing protein [Roseomonas sp. NAR14]|uniref:EI24 domain-containing protein n=1 Tax=Roseomonas acroporae TaxID=2937791 RepID=A0A9X1Y3J4_9PROT|nr:EI24 domain-containing protein [Roseomonas acroporae]MCK8782886.1 EI24 domain-containing protein [Roseomonas acroporae]